MFVINNASFEWSSFLWGGAVGSFLGALLILGIERLLAWIVESAQYRAEKARVRKMLHLELKQNLHGCDAIISTKQGNPDSIQSIHQWRLVWAKKYLASYIDFSREDELVVFANFSGLEIVAHQIEKLEETQVMLYGSAQALSNYRSMIQGNNVIISTKAKELKGVILELCKDLELS